MQAAEKSRPGLVGCDVDRAFDDELEDVGVRIDRVVIVRHRAAGDHADAQVLYY